MTCTRRGRADRRVLALAAGALLIMPGAYADPPAPLPEGAGRTLVEHACANCHSLDNVVRARRTRAQWAAKVDEMIARGARISDDDADAIVEYLAENVGVSADAAR